MKVLILTPFPPNGTGGAETFVKSLIDEAKKNHEVILCTMRPRKKAWKGTGIINLLSVFPYLWLKFVFLICIQRPQIVHAQGLISGIIAVSLKKIFKYKVLITILALYEFNKWSKWKLKIVKLVFDNCDCVFVEGDNGKKDIEATETKSVIKIFQHWCDQTKFKPPQNRDTSKIRVLFIGRPIPEKGRSIIEGAEELLKDQKKYQFTYIENSSYDDLPGIYQSNHIVCVPSLYPEGYSRVVMEAASCGCALITSNRGSLPEMVKGWGLSIEPLSGLFAYEIKRIDFETAGNNASDYANKNFSSNNARIFLDEYN